MVTLGGSKDLLNYLNVWVDKIGLTPSTRLDANNRNGRRRSKELVKQINTYLARVKKEGKKLPENRKKFGCIDWERVSSESGVPVGSFGPKTVAGKRMRKAALELGLEFYPSSEEWYMITYGELLIKGSEWRTSELIGKSNSKAQLYNTRSHLRYFMRYAGKIIRKAEFKDDDPIGLELLEKAEETIRSVTAIIKNKDTRRKFKKEISRWKLYFLRLCRSEGLPPKFSSALGSAIDRAGMTALQVAEQSRVNYSSITAWLTDARNPAVESFPAIRRIEDVLSLPPDTLTSRVIKARPKFFPPSLFPEWVNVNGNRIKLDRRGRIFARMRSLLPDYFDERSEEERLEMITWLIENLVLPTTEWGRWHRAIIAEQYALKKLPLTINKEWSELVVFKRSILPPLGMNRETSWVAESETARKNEFLRFFGFMCLPSEAGGASLPGLGLDPSVLTFSMLIRPAFANLWIRWLAKRRKPVTPSESRKDETFNESYSFHDVDFLNTLISFLTPENGWLRQNPELANKLKPVAGFIDNEFIERAKTDWGAVCDEAIVEYEKQAISIEDVAVEQRDPFELILPLLDNSHPNYVNPIHALRVFSQEIINDMPDFSTAPLMASIHLRNYLITRILSSTALRSRNVRELTYREDNTGNLRRKGEKWEIIIPWQLFKNKNSSFFGSKKKRHNYSKVLADKDGLYQWIEEYVGVRRPLILQGRKSDIFFVNSGACRSPLMAPARFHANYRRLTMIYFAHNPYLSRGFPGVKPHGPHTIRDIFATFIIQLTGSFELAAYAIGDSLETVRLHYTRFKPKDKTKLVDILINAAWDNESGDSSIALRALMRDLREHVDIL